jgi:hypothetical protein
MGVRLTTSHHKTFIAQKPIEASRMDQRTRHRREHGISLGTWNVLSMNTAGTLRKVREELSSYNTATGMMKSDFTAFYSGAEENVSGTGFIVQKNYKHMIMDFKAVNDRISMLWVREIFFNITLFSVHAPTEEREEEIKDAFYDKTIRGVQ